MGRRTFGLSAVAVVALSTAVVGSRPASARVDAAASTVRHVAELSTARPRILLRSGDIATVDARLDRAPYSTLLGRMDTQIAQAPDPSLADVADCGLSANIGREEAKARAAKDLALMYAVNRVWDPARQTVVVPSTAQREALGDRARDYLVDTCVTSRTRVDPDRDINTSNELIQMATAYDTLAGSGYALGLADPVIARKLASWTSDFYDDYQHLLKFLTNNHLAKGAASIGTAAIALGGTGAATAAQLDTWLDFAMTQVQQVVRYTEGSGDGTYGEGPFYWRYASENVVPFARAYDSVSGGRGWRSPNGAVVDDMWTADWFTAIGRWELDMTRPDGTLAPIDDSNVDDAYFFGLLPPTSPDAGAYAWRWSTTATTSAAQPYESTHNVDLSADEIVTFDDGVPAAPPSGSPNRLQGEGGDLVFRSDWGTDAVVAFVQAEHGGSRGFGRAPGAPGIPFAAVHDHADPGSFLLDAYGERLLLDPGYVNYTWRQHGVLSNPSAHNLVLVGPPVDPESPGDPNAASTAPSDQLSAFTSSSGAPVPVDGEAYVSDRVERANVVGATVTSRYGRSPAYVAPNPLKAKDFQELATADSASVQRRFLFLEGRYLVIADSLSSRKPRTYSWPLHGNGGGADGVTDPLPALTLLDRGLESAGAIPATPYRASGGSFTETPAGGEWARTKARVDTGMAFDTDATPTTTVTRGLYEQTHGALGSDSVLSTGLTASTLHAASVIYPTPTDGVAPSVTRVNVPGAAVLRIDDPAQDHYILVVVRAPQKTSLSLSAAETGLPVAVVTDAAITVVDVHADGQVAMKYSEIGDRTQNQPPPTGPTVTTAPAPSSAPRPSAPGTVVVSGPVRRAGILPVTS